MERSGNPQLDVFIDDFKDRLIRKLKERHEKYGKRSITAHGNLPSDVDTLKGFIKHLKQETSELHIELYRTYPRADKIRGELIDVAAMCILIDWCIEECIDTNILDVALEELQSKPKPAPEPPKECPTPKKDCLERGECYYYVCDTCGLEEQFEEHYGEKMECSFCRNGEFIYKGLVCVVTGQQPQKLVDDIKVN